ncbi:MAG: hypothetical protein AAGA54_06935 [Myxococcota bacterium]
MFERALLLFALTGCASAEAPTTSQEEPEPEPPPVEAPEPVQDASIDPEKTQAALLACNGDALAKVTPPQLRALSADDAAPAAARTWAAWETARAFTADGTLEPNAVDALTAALVASLDTTPPRWWIEQLRSARTHGGRPAAYDVGLEERGDRRGAWVDGPAGVRIRPENEAVLAEDDGHLAYDFSVGRARLVKAPDPPNMMAEVTRAHAGSTAFVATFAPGGGGFPFDVHAVGSDSTQRWTATACGPNRSSLEGVGHLTVELVVLQDPPPSGGSMKPARPVRGLAVFNAESHGLAVEVFNADTGEKTFAWTSDLWFHRR